jgi:S-formylglutathione hydrolase FrmB
VKRALAVVAVLGAGAVAVAPAGAALPRFRDADGIHVTSMRALDKRLMALTVSTNALNAPANVRILLPDGYASHRHRRYPVLYLLHGTSGGAADWTKLGDAEQTTTGKPLIVVMPDIALGDDGGGWCTNWFNDGHHGLPEWETFHIDQLIPWVDHNLRTISNRDGRAIAGLSQGGFCSMSYAARHPDLFETALSFSGAPDIAYDTEAQLLVTPVINATEVVLDHAAANSMFGPRLTEEVNWAAHDPATLAENLRGMNVFMYTGNGFPGPLDEGLPNGGSNVIEGGVEILTRLFHQRLEALGISSYYDDYGPGTHTWPYWARDLRRSIDPMMADFEHPLPMPSQITFTAAESSYEAFGWHVTMHRAVEEFSTLKDAGASGFTLQGSGSATVVTPGHYRPGRQYTITVGSRTIGEPADGHGRLTIEVPLGPSDTTQEYPLGGPPLGTTVYTTHVAIARG